MEVLTKISQIEGELKKAISDIDGQIATLRADRRKLAKLYNAVKPEEKTKKNA